MPLTPPKHHPQLAEEGGFTLVELAICMVIFALLSGGLMMTLSARQIAMATTETRHRLNDARDALLGFAATYGRLPCPAAPGTTGTESPPGGGTCSNPLDGLLPAITLGLSPTNSQGYAVDDWGNPLRYSITTYRDTGFCPGHMFATTNCVKSAWTTHLPAPDLHICTTAVGLTGSSAGASCAAGATLAHDVVAVIFSRGINGGAAPRSSDESANGDGDRLYVSHPQTSGNAAKEFDDIVIWLSPSILYYRLIAAGRLP